MLDIAPATFAPAPVAMPLDEAALDAALSAVTLAPRALDKLDCWPGVQERDGLGWRPLVIVSLTAAPMILSADMARRLAGRQDAQGRQGAAHDLIGAADMAEALSHQMQGGLH